MDWDSRPEEKMKMLLSIFDYGFTLDTIFMSSLMSMLKSKLILSFPYYHAGIGKWPL